MRNPTKQRRDALKSTTGKMEHIRFNTFRFGDWVIIKCPHADDQGFNFHAKLGNAMSMNVDGTEVEFMARLEACLTGCPTK